MRRTLIPILRLGGLILALALAFQFVQPQQALAADRLHISKTVDGYTCPTTTSCFVHTNDMLEYNIHFSNTGLPANGVRVTDTLSTGTSFVSASTGCGAVGQLVTCNIGDLDHGASGNLDINVKVTATSGTIPNMASIRAAAGDGEDSNTTYVTLTTQCDNCNCGNCNCNTCNCGTWNNCNCSSCNCGCNCNNCGCNTCNCGSCNCNTCGCNTNNCNCGCNTCGCNTCGCNTCGNAPCPPCNTCGNCWCNTCGNNCNNCGCNTCSVNCGNCGCNTCNVNCGNCWCNTCGNNCGNCGCNPCGNNCGTCGCNPCSTNCGNCGCNPCSTGCGNWNNCGCNPCSTNCGNCGNFCGGCGNFCNTCNTGCQMFGAPAVCGVVNSYQAATGSSPGMVVINGHSYTIAAGTVFSFPIVVGHSYCFLFNSQWWVTGCLTSVVTSTTHAGGYGYVARHRRLGMLAS